MHNRALHDILAAFVEEAAWQLAEEVSGGAEIPFELIEQGRQSAPLYCYRPLTQRFLAERAGSLAKLPSYTPAVQGMMGLPDLPGYLRARGRRPPGADPRAQADAALQAFVSAMWSDATDFTFDAQRFAAAFAELEDAGYDGCALSLVVTPVDGLVIESEEVMLGDGPVARPRRRPARRAARAARRRVRHGRRAGAGAFEPRAGRPHAAPPADRAAPVGRRRAGARADGLGAHRRRAVARHPARHRPAPHDRRLPPRARGGGPAARVLLARLAPHAARRASSRGPCGASSSAASAARPWRP